MRFDLSSLYVDLTVANVALYAVLIVLCIIAWFSFLQSKIIKRANKFNGEISRPSAEFTTAIMNRNSLIKICRSKNRRKLEAVLRPDPKSPACALSEFVDLDKTLPVNMQRLSDEFLDDFAAILERFDVIPHVEKPYNAFSFINRDDGIYVEVCRYSPNRRRLLPNAKKHTYYVCSLNNTAISSFVAGSFYRINPAL